LTIRTKALFVEKPWPFGPFGGIGRPLPVQDARTDAVSAATATAAKRRCFRLIGYLS
jgi:hypothetical protein